MSDSSDKFLYFLVGASIGSVVALLFAPKSGRETRDEITRHAQDSREYLNRKAEKGRNFVEESRRQVSHEVTSMVDRGKEEVDALIDKGKEEVGGLIDKGKDVVQQQKEQFSAAFEAGKEAYLKDKDAD